MTSKEFYRKLLHLASCSIALSYLWFFKDKSIMLIIVGTLTLMSIVIEISRNKNNIIKKIFKRHFNFMLRKDEIKGSFTGATWLLIGNFLTIFIFPIFVAVPALLYLSIGDAIAALVGKNFRRFTIGKKSLVGSFFGFLCGLIFVSLVNKVLPFHILMFGSIVAMITEILPIRFDDNLTIPLLSGSAIMILI